MHSTPLSDLWGITPADWTSAWQTRRDDLLAEIHHQHAAAVHLRARHVCGPDDAADVTQEVFLRLWRNPAAFDPDRGTLSSYLTMLAHSVAVDLVRSSVRRRRRDERSVTPPRLDAPDDLQVSEPVLRNLTAARVGDALDQLDPRHRQAIESRFFDDISFGEAARRNGVPEGTVKSRVRLGLRHLRPVLADLHPESATVQKKARVMRIDRTSNRLVSRRRCGRVVRP
jgi:RNA polymerase sigma factor (sigma-70 family)